MITEQQFYKVQAIIDGRSTNIVALSKRASYNPSFPLRRIVRCNTCGLGLTAAWSKGRNSKYAYYRCSGKCKNSSTKTSLLEEAVITRLKEITPKKECSDLFISFLYKAYYERYGRLQKIKDEADGEIERLQQLRSSLVQKNLTGLYSDELFKEQNAIIEDKIIKAQIAKDDTVLQKYNIDAVTSFIKTILADLGETYKRSNITQLKVLLGSIFPSGLSWSNEDTLNHTISPIYQSIRTFKGSAIPSGVVGCMIFEPV